MASLSSRASEAFLSDAERRENERRKQALMDFYLRNDRVYVGRLAFLRCWRTIKPWINIQSLMGHLMKNGLVNSSDDMEAISSGMLPAKTRDSNLHNLLQANGGGNGYFFFYMSLCESLESNPLGHGDAVDELERAARDCNEQPPWLRNTSYPSGADSSSEMGAQSLTSLPSSGLPSYSSLGSDIQPSTLPSNSTQTSRQSLTTPPTLSEPSSQATPSTVSQSSQQIGPTNPPVSSSPSNSGQPPRPSHGPSSRSPGQGSSQQPYSRPGQRGSHLNPQYQPKDPLLAVTSGAMRLQLASGTSGGAERVVTVSVGGGASVSGGACGASLGGGGGGASVGYGASVGGGGGGRKVDYNKDTNSGSTIQENKLAKMLPLYKKDEYTSNDPLSYSAGNHSFDRPEEEMSRWTDTIPSSLSSDVEKDQPGPPRVSADGRSSQTADTAFLEVIMKYILEGQIGLLCSQYDKQIDFGCCMEGKSSNFMDGVCRFVCGALNTRDSGKVGVFVDGVREPESEDATYIVEGVTFDENGRRSIEQQYRRKLREVVRVHGQLQEELTSEELSLVQLKFIKSIDNRQVAVVTVTPRPAVCRGHMYVCQFRERSGRVGKPECYVRRDGETVHLRQPKKIGDLKETLNQCAD